MSPEALPEAAPGRKGVFVAVVGPSGAGKDTVLKAAAGMLQAEAGVHFVRRVVTRAADAACEDHATLSPDDFIAARESGAFCLSWGAHGLFYGLPASIGDRLADGQTVVANLSRTALADAARRFGGIAVVEIAATPEILAARIAGRGREGADAASARVARRVEVDVRHLADNYLRLDNSGALQPTVDAFVTHLLSLSLKP
ncbi:MAG: phosphonate metabolism protein/1,5-bisphosphokinase (PRPP-forming) PhnN [Rhizobiales bacterium]|nr:phosphonate metabolism protein/1,5-bisphosphokinase (PRPP-forming) PhnN [Hyphomicrobiales bacterium]